jgi:AmmeMemoRadiSam system protein B
MAKNVQPGLRRRFPVVSGIFYPESPATLTGRLASWGLKENLPACGGQSILAPHGAWDLTGSVAASAFASVQKRSGRRSISRVLLLGTHHGSGEEGIYLSESVSFKTPLGDLRVDQNMNQIMASCSTLIRVNDIPHLSEHSLEVLLPLVKYCFPKAFIIPVLMNGERSALISALSKALMITMEGLMEETLIIVSSTVSRSLDPAAAFSMAEEFRSLLENMDARTFLDRLSEGRISACGGALMGAMFKSGLLDGKRFSTLCPLVQGTGEEGETVYYGAFSDSPNSVNS